MAFRAWVQERSLEGAAPRPPGIAPGETLTYRMGWGPWVFMWAVALAFAAMAVAAATAKGAHESDVSRAWAAATFATFAALAVLAGIGMRRTRLTIDATGIEWVEFATSRRLLLEQIRGYRVLRVRAGYTFLVFEPRDADQQKLKIPHIGMQHEAVMSWLSRVPDLDGVDRARSSPPPGFKPQRD